MNMVNDSHIRNVRFSVTYSVIILIFQIHQVGVPGILGQHVSVMAIQVNNQEAEHALIYSLVMEMRNALVKIKNHRLVN